MHVMGAIPGPSYSITLRIGAPTGPPTTTDIVSTVGATGESVTLRTGHATGHTTPTDIASTVGATGAAVTAVDVVESTDTQLVVDVSATTRDESHVAEVRQSLDDLDGVTVRHVSDATFLLHLGGKLEVNPKVNLRHRDDLSRAYTPGVARVCLAIADRPEDSRRLTIKRNTV